MAPRLRWDDDRFLGRLLRQRRADVAEFLRALRVVDLGRVDVALAVDCEIVDPVEVAGIAAAAGKRWDTAETHYQAALGLADRMPFVSEQAESRYWYARMLVDRDATGDRGRANDLLSAALAIYRAVGMPWHVTRAEALAAGARA